MTTFLELRDYARARCMIQQNQVVTEETLGLYLNMSLGALYSIITTDYEDYNLSRYLTAITSGNQAPLPPDFMKLRAVDFGSPGQWTTVFSYGLQERNRNNNPIANMIVPFGNFAARKVRVMNDKLWIEPEQLATGNYQIWYTPKYTWMKNDTDLLPTAMNMNGIVEYAIASTGVKVYNQMGINPTGFQGEVAYYEDIVRNALANRMDNGPQCVVNVTSVCDYTNGFGSGGWGGGY